MVERDRFENQFGAGWRSAYRYAREGNVPLVGICDKLASTLSKTLRENDGIPAFGEMAHVLTLGRRLDLMAAFGALDDLAARENGHRHTKIAAEVAKSLIVQWEAVGRNVEASEIPGIFAEASCSALIERYYFAKARQPLLAEGSFDSYEHVAGWQSRVEEVLRPQLSKTAVEPSSLRRNLTAKGYGPLTGWPRRNVQEICWRRISSTWNLRTPQPKVANCQAGMFLAYVSPLGRALVDKGLYLPDSWTSDKDRCEAAGVPEDRQGYRSKTELALKMVERALERGNQVQMSAATFTYDFTEPGNGPEYGHSFWISQNSLVRAFGSRIDSSTPCCGLARRVRRCLCCRPQVEAVLQGGRHWTAKDLHPHTSEGA